MWKDFAGWLALVLCVCGVAYSITEWCATYGKCPYDYHPCMPWPVPPVATFFFAIVGISVIGFIAALEAERAKEAAKKEGKR